ncbi:MAG: hypothetical protein JSV20_00985 [Candidatus Bathyarchaeota archaeon]|nr:MAG: hypothetical protein JSV20_00985 [Candidatus Bathyarchaeota archaeon]
MYGKNLLLTHHLTKLIKYASIVYTLARALILQNKGMIDKAIENCNKILKFEPDNSVAYYNRSCFNCSKGETKQALSDLAKAIELNPECRSWAKTEKDFDKIRNNPRFKELITEK